MKLHDLQSALASLAQVWIDQPARAQALLAAPSQLTTFLRNHAPASQDNSPPDSLESQDSADLDDQEQQAIYSMLSALTPQQVATLEAAAQTSHEDGQALVQSLLPS